MSSEDAIWNQMLLMQCRFDEHDCRIRLVRPHAGWAVNGAHYRIHFDARANENLTAWGHMLEAINA